jgi:hypothetical protein
MDARIGSAALLTAALMVSGCASPGGAATADAAERDCFSSGRVSGFTPVDGTTVRLRVGVKDTYELTLLGYCPDVDWSQRIALRSVSGSSMICTRDAMGWEILVLDRPGIGPDRCRVRSIRKLEPEAVGKP